MAASAGDVADRKPGEPAVFPFRVVDDERDGSFASEERADLSPRVGDAFLEAGLVESVRGLQIVGPILAELRGGGLADPGQPDFRRISRSASRWSSRLRIASRLSWSFLPLTRAISAFTREPLK